MSTVSFPFILFFLLTLVLYYVVPKKTQWIVLLTASAFFCVYGSDIWLVLVFVAYLFINWTAALKIWDLDKKGHYRRKRMVHAGAIAFNIVTLVVFKDLNLISRAVNGISIIFGKTVNFPEIHLISPLGISYFALILTGYTTDVYWGKFIPESNFFRFCLFGGYFPQMSSGPIVKYDVLSKFLYKSKKFDYDRCVSGCVRVMWGFFKKLVIAERLAVIVNTVYADYVTYAGWYVAIASVLFTLQLYADFSGAMDIALGTSECFGIHLPENFNTPFYAASIAEFWRRWHITLGGWLREYVFYPTQRSKVFRNLKKQCKRCWGKDYEKKFNLPLYAGMFVTWFLIGAWHGGNWSCILMGAGLYYWFLITASEICAPLFSRLTKILKINTECFSWRLFQRIRTFILFSFGLSFFRATSLIDGIKMWRSAFAVNNKWVFFDQSLYSLGLDRQDFGVVAFGVLLILLVGVWKQFGDVRKQIMEQNYMFRLALIMALLFATIVFGLYGPEYNGAGFIYQQF